MALSVVVVAAGSGERLGSATPKAFVPLVGQTLLERSIATIVGLGEPVEIIVVAPAAWVSAAEDLLRPIVTSPHSLQVVSGGASRTQSVRNGLAALSADSTEVLIHDAARPLTPVEVFHRVISALRESSHAVIPTLPVVDTVVPLDAHTGVTGSALDRSGLAAVQTPQGFRTEQLLEAYAAFQGEATDDAEVLRAAQIQVDAVAGHPDSLKVTYPHDLEAITARITGGPDLRVGFGVDVHAFEKGRPLILGGVSFESDLGLAGHSDGDVILHAIADSLLSAGGLGDLGSHFGTDKPEYAGVSSEVFVNTTLTLLAEAGYTPQSVSVQYVGTLPRLGAHRASMAQRLSALVGAPVNVSATTTDGLGLTGRGEGAAVLATALVVRHRGLG